MAWLAGKRAVVLGCGGENNIGQAIASRFVAEGASVVVAGRKEAPIANFALRIGAQHRVCNIMEKSSVQGLAAFAEGVLGGLDIAVQSTGWGYLAPFLENDADSLERITRLQFLGPLFFFQAMIPRMGHRGSLMTLSSVTASIVINDHAAYQGTKAGIDHVVRALAAEFGPRGIRINSIAPAMTETPMTAGLHALRERAKARCPMRRLGTPEDIAATAAWLASDECFITGETIQVNGGYGLIGAPVEAR
jgi:NAD(P)-dependent dehydrogenase (short-subunit alcohol dehydrogenase family)